VSHKADRVAVVLNGNARQVTDELVESFDQLVGSGDLFLSKSLDEAHRVALQIVDAGYPVVLTGGGDGTFVQMVTAITKEARSRSQEPPCFGLLKLGTGNSLAWALGAGTSREGVFADLARLRHDSAHRDFRLIEVQGLLTPFAGAGFDALRRSAFAVGRKARYRRGLLRDLDPGTHGPQARPSTAHGSSDRQPWCSRTS